MEASDTEVEFWASSLSCWCPVHCDISTWTGVNFQAPCDILESFPLLRRAVLFGWFPLMYVLVRTLRKTQDPSAELGGCLLIPDALPCSSCPSLQCLAQGDHLDSLYFSCCLETLSRQKPQQLEALPFKFAHSQGSLYCTSWFPVSDNHCFINVGWIFSCFRRESSWLLLLQLGQKKKSFILVFEGYFCCTQNFELRVLIFYFPQHTSHFCSIEFWPPWFWKDVGIYIISSCI